MGGFVESSVKNDLILIVEDNLDLQSLYKQCLSYDGYLVATADHGKDALDQIRSGAAAPKLIILDLMMPVMNGWEFLKECEQDPILLKIPIIVCSAGTEKQPANVKFIKKPLDRKTLLAIAEQHCKKIS